MVSVVVAGHDTVRRVEDPPLSRIVSTVSIKPPWICQAAEQSLAGRLISKYIGTGWQSPRLSHSQNGTQRYDDPELGGVVGSDRSDSRARTRPYGHSTTLRSLHTLNGCYPISPNGLIAECCRSTIWTTRAGRQSISSGRPSSFLNWSWHIVSNGTGDALFDVLVTS